jgi:hypothetical protein
VSVLDSRVCHHLCKRPFANKELLQKSFCKKDRACNETGAELLIEDSKLKKTALAQGRVRL